MDLHHINPEEKDFSFGKLMANPVSWSKWVVELRKCVLLCSNCHRELYNGATVLPDTLILFNEQYSDYKHIKKETNECEDTCPLCNNKKLKRNKTCSSSCAAKLSYSIDWDKYDLYDLFITKKLTKERISDIVGCSNGAVYKRLKKLKII